MKKFTVYQKPSFFLPPHTTPPRHVHFGSEVRRCHRRVFVVKLFLVHHLLNHNLLYLRRPLLSQRLRLFVVAALHRRRKKAAQPCRRVLKNLLAARRTRTERKLLQRCCRPRRMKPLGFCRPAPTVQLRRTIWQSSTASSRTSRRKDGCFTPRRTADET